MRCLEYSPCLVLANDVEPDISTAGTKNDTIPIKNHSITYVSYIVDGPPILAQDLAVLCLLDSILTLSGLLGYVSACKVGSCCNSAEDEEFSCYDRHPETCTPFQPCTNLVPQGKGTAVAEEEILLPPVASSDLANTCSYESLTSASTADVDCSSLCEPGYCCSSGTCLEEY